MYLTSKPLDNIVIKNIMGEIVYIPKNYKDKVSPQEYIIKLLVSRKLLIDEYILLFRYIKAKDKCYELKQLTEYILKMNGYRYFNDPFENFLFNNCITFDGIIKKYYKDKDYDELFKLLDINSSLLNDKEKQQLLENIFYRF